MLDVSILARDGYSYKITKDGKEIKKVTVDGDTEIKVVYTKTTVDPLPEEPTPSDPTPEEPIQNDLGCFGGVNASFMGLLLVVMASVLIFVKKSFKKEGKQDA